MKKAALLTVLVLALTAPSALAAPKWTSYDRPETNGIVVDRDVPVTMSDGVILSADVYRPDKPGRYPTLLTQTPYNKGGPLSTVNEYLVKRGYAHIVVDVRGTGGSQGAWDSFGPAEQRDGAEMVAWARKQPWSNGKIGGYGPSYMAITQLTTAARRPKGLKAIFPIVPMADSYRDITFSGGQTNVSFIPLWLGLVTGASLVPPNYALSGDPADLVRAITTLASHAANVGNFQLNTVLNAAAGGDISYDGEFWRARSPIELLDRIKVPAFVVGGHHDLFQRGEPLVYERLKGRVPSRLLMGPWTHLGGSSGDGLADNGLPSLSQIALRWFDRWLRGIDTKIERIPRVTQWTYGPERYETQADWPDPRLRPTRRYLRAGNALSTERPKPGEGSDSFVQHPVSGVCTQSTSQWTAGITESIPCTNDNRLNELTGVNYTTTPLAKDMSLNGPLLASLWVRTSARDAVVSVRVTDVAPDGTSRELTGGWLAASFRRLDREKSRYVRGKLLQPWHPFTRDSVQPVEPGRPVKMAVEVFPLNAVIQRGHRLRVSVNPSDFPHAVPPLPQFSESLGGQVQVLHDARHASSVTLPTLRPCRRCRALRPPDFTR